MGKREGSFQTKSLGGGGKVLKDQAPDAEGWSWGAAANETSFHYSQER